MKPFEINVKTPSDVEGNPGLGKTPNEDGQEHGNKWEMERPIQYVEEWNVEKDKEVLKNVQNLFNKEEKINGDKKMERPIQYEGKQKFERDEGVLENRQNSSTQEEQEYKSKPKTRPIQYENKPNTKKIGEQSPEGSEDSGQKQTDKYKIENLKGDQEEPMAIPDRRWIQPIELASKEADQMARVYCEKIADCPDCLPFLANAFEEYMKAGGKIKSLMPQKPNSPKKAI